MSVKAVALAADEGAVRSWWRRGAVWYSSARKSAAAIIRLLPQTKVPSSYQDAQWHSHCRGGSAQVAAALRGGLRRLGALLVGA